MPGSFLSANGLLKAIIHMDPGPRRVSGRAQDTTRGGPGDRVVQQRVKTWDAYSKYPAHLVLFMTSYL